MLITQVALLVTIAVSIGVLLLLARFRFPEQAAESPATPAAAPLERLAARAAYEELASTMADLERRLAGRVVVLRVEPTRDTGSFIVAPRLTADRAVAVLQPSEMLPGDTEGTSRILARDVARQFAVVSVPANADTVVAPRSGAPRPGPRYIVAVEGSSDGLTLRPVYVGRTAVLQDPRTSTMLLSMSGLQQPLAAGSALFSLEGTFIGLVMEGGRATTVLPGDVLQAVAQNATPAATAEGGYLGIDLEPLTDAVARAAGVRRGVVVTGVHAGGPAAGALRPGDVIEAVDDVAATSVAAFREAEHTRAPGQAVTLSVDRRRAPEKITVKAASPRAAAAATAPPDAGFVGRTVSGAGIEVVAVRDHTPASRAGLARGDLIVAIDGAAAESSDQLERLFRTAAADTAWLLTVQRGGDRQTLALEKR